MDKATEFHPGELFFQKKIGVEKKVASLAPRLIQSKLTMQHRDFFSQLTMLFVTSVDESGQPWASVLTASPGFIDTQNDDQITINAKPVNGDPLNKNLAINSHIGLLGLEFETRRRNRISGIIAQHQDSKIILNVTQAFGNCPKYIQSRNIQTFKVNKDLNSKPAIIKFTEFDHKLKKLISTADTFFIASYYPQQEHRGADISHRGGKPGFVSVDDNKTLSFEDYRGNNIFMTLGNILSNPVAGLLFIDFKTGDLIQLACKVEVIDSEHDKYKRKIRLTLESGWMLKSALKIESELLEYSPFL